MIPETDCVKNHSSRNLVLVSVPCREGGRSTAMEHMVMNLGGIDIHYGLRFSGSAKRFGWHSVRSKRESADSITIPEELFLERKREFSPEAPDSFVEFRTLVEPTGRYLCDRGVFIMHAAAFRWRERAWLLTAPSGTGKTTQYLNWKKLWPDEVSMICGDMPVLRTDERGEILACPSPWNGKERLGRENHDSCPLGGVVYLAQSDTNRITKADFRELILLIWGQFIGIPDTENQIRSRERFLNQLLKRYPVWKYENRGDEASTELMRRTFGEYLQGKESRS